MILINSILGQNLSLTNLRYKKSLYSQITPHRAIYLKFSLKTTIQQFLPNPSHDRGIPNPFNSRLLPQILTKPIPPQKRKVTKKEFALFAKRLKEICDAPEAVSSDPESVTIIPQVKLEHSIQEESHKSKGPGQITITGEYSSQYLCFNKHNLPLYRVCL